MNRFTARLLVCAAGVAVSCNRPAALEQPSAHAQPAVRTDDSRAALLKDLPSTANGKPILAEVAEGRDSPELRLVYDEGLHDVVTDWGSCLAQVQKCDSSDDDNAVASCIEAVSPCRDERADSQCCPESCLENFVAARSKGDALRNAVNAVFVRGDCFPGFAELLRDEDEP